MIENDSVLGVPTPTNITINSFHQRNNYYIFRVIQHDISHSQVVLIAQKCTIHL